MLHFKAPSSESTFNKTTSDQIEIQRCTPTARWVSVGASMHTESEYVKCWVMWAESCTIWGKMEKLFLSACAIQTSELSRRICALLYQNLHLNNALMMRGSQPVCHFSHIHLIYLGTNQYCFYNDYEKAHLSVPVLADMQPINRMMRFLFFSFFKKQKKGTSIDAILHFGTQKHSPLSLTC